MDKTPKEKAPDPAARPSRPSVRFTALEEAITTKMARTIHPTIVRFQPGRLTRVKERCVEVPTQVMARTAKATAMTS